MHMFPMNLNKQEASFVLETCIIPVSGLCIVWLLHFVAQALNLQKCILYTGRYLVPRGKTDDRKYFEV